MRDVELPVLRSFRAPCFDELSILREFDDPGIATLPVGYKKIAVRGNGDIAGAVEQVHRVMVAGHSLFAERHKLFLIDRKIVHYVIVMFCLGEECLTRW